MKINNLLKSKANDILEITKGQLISKCLCCIFNSPKKQTKKINYYGTSSRIIFVYYFWEN